MQELNWWIEISINNLFYIYYVGAFKSFHEAKRFEGEYLRSLDRNKAKVVSVLIKQCTAKELNTTVWKKNKEQKGFAIIEKNLNKDILLDKISKLAEIIYLCLDFDIKISSK